MPDRLLAIQKDELKSQTAPASDLEQRNRLEQWLKFNTDAVKHVGVFGNDTKTAKDGFKLREKILNTAQPSLKNQWQEKYPLAGGQLQQYQGLSKEFGVDPTK